MQCTIERTKRQRQWGASAHTLAVLGLLMLAVTGLSLESLGGWVACPPQWMGLDRRVRPRCQYQGFAWRAGWQWLRQSWLVAALRSESLLVLVFVSGRQEWEWLCWLPWIGWLWQGLGVAWPGLGRQALYRGLGRVWEEGNRWALIGLGLVWLGQKLAESGGYGGYGLVVGMSCQRPDCGEFSRAVSEPRVEVQRDEQGMYHVRLRGELELQVDGTVTFYKRMLAVFLGQLEAPGESRSSRRTRDGRTPLVRQQQMETWLGVPQPQISEWMAYWLEMWQHLQAQGSPITLKQVKQVARESGWTTLREALSRVYGINAASFRPRDEWLTQQLLAQVQGLVARLEALGGLTPEQQMTLADLEALCDELDLHPAAAQRPLPWLCQVQRLLFGQWAWLDDGSVCCIYCGTTAVSRKSRKPRLKRYVDAQGQIQTVEVYRYYCHNPACKYKSFTNLPPHLLPHSRWTLDHHLAALQSYAWSRSVYRCTSQLLGVSTMTAYRWVSGFGYQLLPVAALFGVVRSSGVVGIDEKYVLVPKNDKPVEKMSRWMYVYFAVDCYTYDLLHIEIYPYNTRASARAFLLALRAKGYRPRVVVTDMRVDYRDVVAQVFPKAVHHVCIFHALQEVHERCKDIYGLNYAQRRPDVVTLRHEIGRIFDARTKRTAQRRYENVLAQRETFVSESSDAAALFDFLERHWPRLVNAIESHHIPRTNNATEQVIRIFTQHYKTFCGFESIDSAQRYLAVFEKVYRFTPFSDDAQVTIRGKCPLALAGYEVQNLPMVQLFRGLALQWPASAFQELVPNV
jgi:transposase-like protein